MKVVFSCVPQTGHVMPLLPLAHAFVAQGDDVIVASGPDVAEIVTSRGLAFRPVGPAFVSWFGALRARTRGLPGDGLKPERVQAYFTPRLFGEIGMALVLDDLLSLCKEVEPSLVVFDPYFFAAPLAAALTGAHAVLHSIGPLMDPGVGDLVTDAVSPIWREFGIDVPVAAGVYAGTTLTICPPSLDAATADILGAHALRPVQLPRTDRPDLSVTFADPRRPLVYLTLGTFSNNNIDLFRLILESLRDESVNVLATIGRNNDPAVLGTLPDNARVERFIPQTDVLPHCAAAIHHAGAGTMFGILAHGLPSIALPQSADNFTIADRLASAGVAHVLPPAAVTGDAIRAGLRAVLELEPYRQQARHVAAEIAAMPAPPEVAAQLRRQA